MRPRRSDSSRTRRASALLDSAASCINPARRSFDSCTPTTPPPRARGCRSLCTNAPPFAHCWPSYPDGNLADVAGLLDKRRLYRVDRVLSESVLFQSVLGAAPQTEGMWL